MDRILLTIQAPKSPCRLQQNHALPRVNIKLNRTRVYVPVMTTFSYPTLVIYKNVYADHTRKRSAIIHFDQLHTRKL